MGATGEVGLYYFGKRYLNPLLGRWVSADPLGVQAPGKADLNLYAYVSGQALRAVDVLGLQCAAGAGGTCGEQEANPSNGTEGQGGGTGGRGQSRAETESAPRTAAEATAAGAAMGTSAALLPVGGEAELSSAMKDLRGKLSPKLYDAWLKGVAAGAEATGVTALNVAYKSGKVAGTRSRVRGEHESRPESHRVRLFVRSSARSV